jgi:hypothetical protein
LAETYLYVSAVHKHIGGGVLTGAVEVEITKLLCSGSSIVVSRVESLVVLNETDQSLLLGQVDELLMILDLLRSRLGD